MQVVWLILALFFTGCAAATDADNGAQSSSLQEPAEAVSPLGSPYYLTAGRNTSEKQPLLNELFVQLANTTPEQQTPGRFTDEENLRFTYVREIANEYARQNQYEKLANFLSLWVNEHPDDKFNSYYLLMTAWAYTKLDAYPVAAIYFNEIVRNFDDLSVRGQSIHLTCLRELIILSNKPEQRIWYYEELLTRFPNDIDLAQTWFLLGQSLEEVGEWDSALEAYTEFLNFYGTEIPGFPNAYSYAKHLIDFRKSSKDWTFESLDSLLRTIESSLDTGNVRRLWQYRAKVNFFSRSWAQEESDETETEFNLSAFPANSRLYYENNLSPGSNANEAYLKTWGWPQLTSIWYFYFRKIYFPLDPEIHGRWEWAGIYYGEKF
jgi:predicted Zn-dependent protease